MNIAEKKTFNFFRVVAITALVCTIILWAGLWISSGIPSSRALNDAISSSMDNSFDLNTSISGSTPTAFISFDYPHGIHFDGDTAQLNVHFFPTNAKDREVEFSSNNENVATIDENGKIYYHKSGKAVIEARLKNNHNIAYSRSIWCHGEPITKGSPYTVAKIRQYESKQSVINHGKTDKNAVQRYYSADESIATIDRHGYVRGVTVGTTTIYAEFSDVVLSCPVEVVPYDDFIAPTSVSVKENLTFAIGSYYSFHDVVDVYPQNALFDIKANSSDESIIVTSCDSISITNFGEVTLTFFSEYDPTVRVEKTLYIEPIHPTALSISAPNVIIPHRTYYLQASHMPTAYNTSVKWEVLKGNATIDENGSLRATFWGDVVVRCTSTIDPTLYTDVTITCQIFDNAYSFVRKLMGHFGLSALLGFGIFYTVLLLSKHKQSALIATPIMSLVYAFISEFIQYFTPTRNCALTDVIIDFMGTILGMGVAMVLFAIVALACRLAGKKSFGVFASSVKQVNIHTLKLKAYSCEEYSRENPHDVSQEQSTPLAS